MCPSPSQNGSRAARSQSAGRVKLAQHTMSFNVYVTNKGRAVSAHVEQSTLGDRDTEACMVAVLRETRWPGKAGGGDRCSVCVKSFFRAPAPALRLQIRGRCRAPTRRAPTRIQAPQGQPDVGGRFPRIFVIPLNPLVAGAVVFGVIYFWLDTDALPWMSEMNPITREPYTGLQEYEAVKQLTQQQIQQAQIKATESQPPPASTPPPAPSTPAQREQEKKAQRCTKIAGQIHDIIYAKRDATPKGGFPQGRKGIAERWREIAENKGKWGRNPNGELIDKAKNHLKEYTKGQDELKEELKNWKTQTCEDNGHTLPPNARQYAAQKPEFGPGKPLEPAPTPTYSPAATPPVIAPKDKKRSE
jgi:hypothetical protein